MYAKHITVVYKAEGKKKTEYIRKCAVIKIDNDSNKIGSDKKILNLLEPWT